MAPFSFSLLRSQLRRNSKGFVPGTILLLVLLSLFHLDLFSPSSPLDLDDALTRRPSFDDVSFDSPPLLAHPNPNPNPPKPYDGSNPFLALDENGKPIPFQPPSSKSTAKKKPPRKVKNAASFVEPVLPDDFPSRESLPLPKDFPQFLGVKESKPPNVTFFDDETMLSKIRPLDLKRKPLARGGNWTSPRGTFAREWEDPVLGERVEDWPKVQFQDWEEESEEEKELREGRKEVVKGAFLHAWSGYKALAWQHDEIRPLSGVASDPFMMWGASIIDSLDTLLLLGLPNEYVHARKHVREVDFGIISGIDWGRNGERSGKRVVSVHGFETIIRYMGGLLGAYDLSGDKLLLDRAEELGKILLPIFDTSSGVPLSRINPANPKAIYGGHSIQLAEAGTLSLEYCRLSQLTGNGTYFSLAHRGMSFMNSEITKQSPFAPLLPTIFSTELYKGGIQGTFSFGGMSDSYYEYLIKLHVLLRGSTPLYSKMYSSAIDKASTELIRKVSVVPGKPDLMTAGELRSGRYQYALEHLSCFVPAMLALGSKILERPQDMVRATKISQTCYFVGSAMNSGMQPERADFYLPDEPKRFEKIEDEDSGEIFTITKGTPAGVKSVHKHYISRPESIESVFYLYRVTGDRRYQDQGWRMFTSWISRTETKLAFSSTLDVRFDPITKGDNMESFVFAETFKYYYLLFADPSELSLDDYVLSTEAHPFIHNPLLKPGSSGLWDPSLVPENEKDAPIGEGTSVQKAAVLLEKEMIEALTITR
ncbi:glycoside hydrolase [Mrakia frigida]|uniref:glycoside hydrolase family 47 protein n=1 Tax=Mrakia frigida TaxID=29902 RepID=UPI003FCC0CED